MTRPYVILHEQRPRMAGPALESVGARPGAGPGAGTRGIEAPAAKVEVDTLSPATAHALVQTKKVAAAAPVMPMKLIAPVQAAVAEVAPSAGGSAWGVAAVKADSSPFDGSDIVVAVLDTGIDPAHPAFAGVQLVRRNFTAAGDDDTHGHGTHCAGTIFGRAVGGMRIGVAPGVAKALIGKVLGPGGGGSDRIAEAIQWAVNEGAHVISMSLGIDFPGYVAELIRDDVPPDLATSMALEGYRANVLLFERLASFVAARALLGVPPTLLMAAAGNESRREVKADYEIAVSPPAVVDGMVSVAALGQATGGLVVAKFSNTGARVSAPGVDIVSARAGGGLTAMSGTSMATPHVAGVAALWAQKLAQASQLAREVWMTRLLGSSTLTGLAAGFDPADVGVGLIQAPQP